MSQPKRHLRSIEGKWNQSYCETPTTPSYLVDSFDKVTCKKCKNLFRRAQRNEN